MSQANRNAQGASGPGRAGGLPPSPGDEAPPGTPGSGETVCPRCGGSGRDGDQPCSNCSGTGKVVQGVGGG